MELDPPFEERVVSLRQLAERISRAATRLPSFVAVDGPGGAGKSSLAARLAAALPEAEIVPTDDFASWEVPLDWWPRLLAEVLEPLAAGLEARYRRYDWVKRELGAERIVSPRRFVLLEGVSSGRREFRPYLDFVIWVETEREERLRRGLERDGEDMRQQWLEWMSEEDRHITEQRTPVVADLTISGSPSLAHDPSRQVVVLAAPWG